MQCFEMIAIEPFSMGKWEFKTALVTALEEIFKISVCYQPDISVPPDTYNVNRDQYRARELLEELTRIKTGNSHVILGITKIDLYEPELNFVFGLASTYEGVSVISVRRLSSSFYGLAADDELYFARILTEAVHEIGHVLSLPHCPDARCVMHFSNSPADTDEKGYHFCPSFQDKMERAKTL